MCHPSLATGFSSAPAKPRAAQSVEGKQLCLIALIKIKRNPTVWSCKWSAARTLSAGKMKRNVAVILLVIDLSIIFKGYLHDYFSVRCD